MKRFITTIICLCIFCIRFAFAQYTHPTTGQQSTSIGNCPVTLCSGTFTDNGGSGVNYSANINGTVRTFCAQNPGEQLRASFTSFTMNDTYFLCGGPNSCCDYLQIYDGPTIESPMIFNNCTTSPGIVTSTSGCLTFRFISDGSVQLAGWQATFSCVVGGPGGQTANTQSDCANAIPLWTTGPVVDAATGPGLVAEGCSGCVVGEYNSSWHSFCIQSSGTLAFTIDPNTNTTNYDFALYGPNVSCGTLGTPIRCSGAIVNGTGNTGLGNSAVDNSEAISGDQWVAPLNVLAGQTYYLLINRYTNASPGFTFSFTGTAVLDDCTNPCIPPVITGNPPNRTTCAGNNTTFGCMASGATAYQWQVNTGSGYSDITDGGVYSDATTSILTLTGVTPAMSGYLYRCRAEYLSPACFTNSNAGTLTVSTVNTSLGSQTNISCFGGANGVAAVTPSGGIAPYTYAWSPSGGTGSIATGLSANTYTVTVMDNIGCTATRNYTITQPTAISLTPFSQTNVSCFGGSNGAAAVNTATGGAGGYTYNWTPGNPTGDGTTSVTGLSAATWTVVVTDANSCTASQSFTVTQPTALSLTPSSQTNVSCFGGSNGAAAVNTATGGAGGYTYNWTPGNPTGDGTTSVTGLNAATWTVVVTDANACTASQSFTVTQPSAISLTASSQTNVSCNGASNGAAAVNAATGGAGGYTYDWTPGTPTGDGTTSVTGLTAGTWTCVVTDANGCTSSRPFTITQPTAISLTPFSQTNVSCFGGSNGAAAVNTATGGAGGYTYNWTPGNPTGDGTTSISGLPATTWTVVVTDANACTASQSFTVTQPTAISLTPASQTNIACNGGSTGAAAVNTATGGAGGYTYNWTPGNPTGDGTTSVTGLTAGTWTCVVTDANSCTASQSFTVTQASAISLTPFSQTNVSCFGGSNGAAAVNTATGGAGGYTYNWTPGNPTGDGTTSVTGLSATTWTVVVTDANACTASQSFTVTQPTAISLTPASQINIACNGGSTGAAAVNTATGGAGGYTYNWTPGNPTGDGTTSVTGLTAGTWTCVVTDANSCTASQSFTVTQASAISLTPSSQTNVSCFGGSNGAAAVNTATGGAGGYTYNWTPGNPTGDGTTSVTGLSATTWTVVVTDANACTASQSFTVTQPSALALTPSSQTNVSCFGGSNGAAAVNTATGGAGGYTYNWTPGNPTGDGTTSITGLSAGTWTCVVTDANACTASQSFTVTQPTAITMTPFSQTNVSCNGASNGAAAVNAATGGAGGYTYDWTPGTPTGDGTTSVTGLSAGTWTCIVTDANSCVSSQSFTITQPSALVVTPVSQTNIACNSGSTGAASVSVSGGTPGYTYDWTPGSPTGDGTSSVTGLSAGTWTCVVTDANACTATQSFTITQPSTISLTASSQTNVSCFGGSDGAAAVNAATGGAGGYTYDWTPGNPTGDGTTSVSGLTTGTWTCIVTDANSCVSSVSFFIVEEVDSENPLITCIGDQVVSTDSGDCFYIKIGSDWNMQGTDNCSVNSTYELSGATIGTGNDLDGILFNSGLTSITWTATDGSANSAFCSFTVTVNDNEVPVLNCPENFELSSDALSCSAVVNYSTPFGTDNCTGSLTIQTAGLATGSAFPAGTTLNAFRVTDAAGNSTNCSFSITVTDDTEPIVACSDTSMTFNGGSEITLNAMDLVIASDNCEVSIYDVNPPILTNANIGQVVPVTVTVTDINGNSSSCISNINVSGLPVGWSQSSNGIGCSEGSNTEYEINSQVFTATSSNCYYGSPFTSDASAFAQYTLCGNGSITVQVTSITGNALGWAGIVMRESNAPGAKKVQIMTNLSSFHRREVRTVTNGPAMPQQFPAQNRYWLRIVRTGNQFVAYSSPNGINWFQTLVVNVPMNSCIEAGLVVTNYNQNSIVTATFANVNVVNNNISLIDNNGHSIVQELKSVQADFSVYPNPTSGELNIDLQEYFGKNVVIELYGLEGKLLISTTLEEVSLNVQTIDMSQYANGMYFIKLKSDGMQDKTKKFIIAKY